MSFVIQRFTVFIFMDGYIFVLFQEMNLQALSEERDSLSDDCDSGNDEPSDYFPLERGASNSNTPQVPVLWSRSRPFWPEPEP